MTNYERIKAMEDVREMAWLIDCPKGYQSDRQKDRCAVDMCCSVCKMAWLESEVQDEES